MTKITLTPAEALLDLAEIIRSIRDEQISDAIFGGPDGERADASRIYAARILTDAGKIDDLLGAIFPEDDDGTEPPPHAEDR